VTSELMVLIYFEQMMFCQGSIARCALWNHLSTDHHPAKTLTAKSRPVSGVELHMVEKWLLLLIRIPIVNILLGSRCVLVLLGRRFKCMPSNGNGRQAA
jgi:hypothetical protein